MAFVTQRLASKHALREQEVIPALFYTRLLHKELKPYKAVFTKKDLGGGTTAYTIRYPELDRELTIRYGNAFLFPA